MGGNRTIMAICWTAQFSHYEQKHRTQVFFNIDWTRNLYSYGGIERSSISFQ